jgi:MSV199 domain/T5orf172 domain
MSLDIVSLISNNPITKLSKPYQNKLLNKIKGHFTTDEQHMFVTSFYCYLNHSDDEFVIDFDNVWEWMGFTRLDNAKRTLYKHFTQDVDYKILLPGARYQDSNEKPLLPKEERFSPVQNGGQNKETILVTLSTFKDMCMRANTKKAKEIRTYYTKLEKILMELVNEEAVELRLQLEQKDTMLKATETALDFEKQKFMEYTRRRYINEPKGERVYVMQGDEHDPYSEMKIGKTDNMRDRECGHNTSNNKSKVVHVVACYNSDLLEKVAHHMLAKHRPHKFREWFQVNLVTATEIINIAQLVLDDIIPISELLAQHKVYDKFKAIVESIKSADPETYEAVSSAPQEPIVVYKNKYEKQNEAFAQNKEQLTTNIATANDALPPLNIRLPLDFARFVSEQCEVGDDYKCLNVEIYGAHKLWSQNHLSSTKSALVKYMAGNYTSKKIFYPDLNATLATFIGLRPKPLSIPEGTDEITAFINDRCKLGYTYRCNYNTLFSEFKIWKSESIPSYELDTATKTKLRDFVNDKFLASHVYLNVSNLPDMEHNTSTHGVWGITLKNDNSNTGIKLSHKLKKRVVAIDIATNQIVQTFDSVTSTISTAIRFERIHHNCIFRFMKEDGTLVVRQRYQANTNPVSQDNSTGSESDAE